MLRIEDIDAERRRPEAIESAVEDLRWLGFDWDGPPILQSARLRRYDEALQRLRELELIYPCTCTRADIARSASAPHDSEQGPAYPGTCSVRSARDAETLARIDSPGGFGFRAVSFRGTIWLGDRSRLSRPRSAAILSSAVRATRRRINSPSSSTTPLWGSPKSSAATISSPAPLNKSCCTERLDFLRRNSATSLWSWTKTVERLAKRDGSIKLGALRSAGADPQLLIGLLARGCGWSRRLESSSPADWIERFSFDTIPAEPWKLRREEIENL